MVMCIFKKQSLHAMYWFPAWCVSVSPSEYDCAVKNLSGGSFSYRKLSSGMNLLFCFSSRIEVESREQQRHFPFLTNVTDAHALLPLANTERERFSLEVHLHAT